MAFVQANSDLISAISRRRPREEADLESTKSARRTLWSATVNAL